MRTIIYAKRPFAGPAAVLAYLSRYTHRVALSNGRLIAADSRGVTFTYKDYRRAGSDRYRTMTLGPPEFIRRFLIHVLPKGFHRIRHYGLFASAERQRNIAQARELLAAPAPKVEKANDPDAELEDRHLMTTSAITTPQRCFVLSRVLGRWRRGALKLPAHAAPEPGSPLSNAAGAHHSPSLTLTSAVDPCSRPSRRHAALPSAGP